MSRSVSRHWERARAYLRRRNLPAAGAQLESLRALAPGDVRTHLLAAQIALHEDPPHDAATRALDAARVAPEDPCLLGELIDTLLRTGESAMVNNLCSSARSGNRSRTRMRCCVMPTSSDGSVNMARRWRRSSVSSHCIRGTVPCIIIAGNSWSSLAGCRKPRPNT